LCAIGDEEARANEKQRGGEPEAAGESALGRVLDKIYGGSPIKLEPNARIIAAHVVLRVHTENAFAAAVLDAALDRYPELERRDRALATELAYGALRTAPYLEKRLSKHAKKGTRGLDETPRPWPTN